MQTLRTGIGLYLLIASSAVFGQTTGTCERPFEAKFQPGGKIHMELRSGDIEVRGSDSPMLRISCELRAPGRAKEVTIKFTSAGSFSDLRIRGGPNGDVRFRIEVPKNLNLSVRAPAGVVNVSGVTGDKNIEIHAGDLIISVGNADDYRHADASVYAGDVSASAFGVTKGGLFRSFDKDNPKGKYRLHAHVGAGELVLN